jgi:hypothetical protein
VQAEVFLEKVALDRLVGHWNTTNNRLTQPRGPSQAACFSCGPGCSRPQQRPEVRAAWDRGRLRWTGCIAGLQRTTRPSTWPGSGTARLPRSISGLARPASASQRLRPRHILLMCSPQSVSQSVPPRQKRPTDQPTNIGRRVLFTHFVHCRFRVQPRRTIDPGRHDWSGAETNVSEVKTWSTAPRQRHKWSAHGALDIAAAFLRIVLDVVQMRTGPTSVLVSSCTCGLLTPMSED